MPKNISNEIVDLVKSLTKAEKRYFKLYASMGNVNEDAIYIHLFNYMDSTKKYSDEKALQKIPNAKHRQLSNQKRYLYELLVESLTLFHAGKSVDSRLRLLLNEIELLYSKALFKQTAQTINRAKILARRYEKYNHLSALNILESKLLFENLSDKGWEAEANKLSEEGIIIGEKIKTLAQFRKLYAQLVKLNRSSGLMPEKESILKAKKILKHQSLDRRNIPQIFNERLYYYTIQAQCYFIFRNWEKCYYYYDHILTDFERHPYFKDDLAQQYISSLGKAMQACIILRKESTLESNFNKVRSLIQSHSSSRNSHIMGNLLTSIIPMLTYYCDSGEFHKGIKLIEQIKDMIAIHHKSIRKNTEIIFYYNFACMYFGASEYRRSLTWVNKILNENWGDVRSDLQQFCSLFYLMIHFEIGNTNELGYFAKSTHRALMKREKKYKLETSLVDFFRTILPKVNSKKERVAVFIKLRSNFMQLKKDKDERIALDYFDFISWIDSKIENRSVADIAKEKWKMGVPFTSN